MWVLSPKDKYESDHEHFYEFLPGYCSRLELQLAMPIFLSIPYRQEAPQTHQ